jgi:hypothetical protein
MHKGLVITGAVLAAATLCLAFAAWMAGPGQWRAVLAVLAAMSGLGVAAVWFATVVVFDLSGRDEWIVTCLAASALALAFGVFKLGPTTGALVLGLGSGPLVATLSVIRQVSWGQWPGWSKRARKPRVRKSPARSHRRVAQSAARTNVEEAIELVKSSGRSNPPAPGDELEGPRQATTADSPSRP